jgi:serine/threonine protein kinase
MMSSREARLKYIDCDLNSQPIGEGAFGKVYRAHRRGRESPDPRSRWSEAPMAVKVVKIPRDIQDKRRLSGEIELMCSVRHPAVLSLFAWGRRKHGTDASLSYLLVTRLLETSLDKVIAQERRGKPHPKWNATRKSMIAIGIAAGMAYLHTNRPNPIIHRDLKPANILLDDNLEPVICDFGLSRFVDPDDPFAATLRVGTLAYMAPEVMGVGSERPDFHYGPEVDVYSYALILFELVTGKDPVQFVKVPWGKNFAQCIADGQRPAFPEGMNQAWREFIEACWAQAPEERGTFMEMLRTQESVDAFRLDGCDETEFRVYCSKVLGFLESH